MHEIIEDALETIFNPEEILEGKPMRVGIKRVILSPGVYNVELKYTGYSPVILEGLYDNPWSEKEENEKTFLTQVKDKENPLFVTYGDSTLRVSNI